MRNCFTCTTRNCEKDRDCATCIFFQSDDYMNDLSNIGPCGQQHCWYGRTVCEYNGYTMWEGEEEKIDCCDVWNIEYLIEKLKSKGLVTSLYESEPYKGVTELFNAIDLRYFDYASVDNWNAFKKQNNGLYQNVKISIAVELYPVTDNDFTAFIKDIGINVK